MFASLLSAAPWLNNSLFSLLVLVLVLMGLQGIAYAPAAGLNHWLRLVCLPPDPGLSIPHRSCHCFCWLQLPSILCLGLLSSRYWHKSMDPPLRRSPQPGASQRGGMPHVHPSSVCFSLVLTLRLPTEVPVHLDQLHCSMFCPLTPIQHLLQVHSRFPALHHGLLALLSGYGLLWWLTQYNLLLQSVHIPEFWFFFTLQLVPVYCRLLCRTYKALTFWSELLLSTLMVPCQHSPPMTHVCGYGSWFIPPRRRRRRGESPIRIPRLRQSPYISSISQGVSVCVGFALQGWLRAFERCVNRFSAVLQESATICDLV
jgi:hypothetical protein